MLNLNYNIVGAIKQEFKATNQYQIRPDPYSASIVLAIPGNLFKNGLEQNQFGMSQPYDDISAYVRGGGIASGSNLTTYISASLNPNSSSFYATSSYVKWDNPQDRYEQSLYFAGTNALVVDKFWAAKQGGNLTFDKSFVIETYAGFAATGSYTPPGTWTPNRIFAWKYDPSSPTGSSYLFQTFGGDRGEGIVVTGSLIFYYDFGDTEGTIAPNPISNPIGNYAWNHYAVAYNSNARRISTFINGVVQKTLTLSAETDINQDLTELLQVMGAVDADWSQGSYSGSQAIFQDFRVYNGTDKGYAGDGFTPPPSIVTFV
jgi:hypothetical protein